MLKITFTFIILATLGGILFFAASHELKLRVVDEKSQPLDRARISGYTSYSTSDWKSHLSNFEEYTDEKGEFTKRFWFPYNRIVIDRVHLNGYYPFEESMCFDVGKIPGDYVVVTMQREHPKVLMLKNRFTLEWEKGDAYSFGLRFRDGTVGSGKYRIKRSVVVDRKDAMLWLDIQPQDQTTFPTRFWTIKLTALNGWEIAPGPFVEQNRSATEDWPPMREAPAEGYGQELSYPSERCPVGFYLRFAGGKRYGKLFDFEFKDESRDNIIERRLFINYCVQVKDTNNRSLNAISYGAESAEQKEILMATEKDTVLLFQAVKMKDTKLVQAILNEGTPVDSEDEYGRTPLYIAAEEGMTEIVKFLLDHGANINIHIENWYKDTPLIIASEYGRTEVVNLLIEKGADVNAKNEKGYVPLMEASSYGYIEIINILMKKGAKLNERVESGSEKGLTAFGIAKKELKALSHDEKYMSISDIKKRDRFKEIIVVLEKAGATE